MKVLAVSAAIVEGTKATSILAIEEAVSRPVPAGSPPLTTVGGRKVRWVAPEPKARGGALVNARSAPHAHTDASTGPIDGGWCTPDHNNRAAEHRPGGNPQSRRRQ